MQELLKVQDLSISFSNYHSTLHRGEQVNIQHLNLTLYEGEIVAVIGASGSGKSLLAHALLDILPQNARTSGKIYFKGKPLTSQKIAQLRGREMAFIPQSVNSLDPLVKVKKQLLFRYPDRVQQMYAIFSELELDRNVGELYPHQLSGGMARRILFATALMENPSLFIADEPTPGMGLHQATHALDILKKRVEDEQKTVLLITHDIDLAVAFANRIFVFFEGKIIDWLSSQSFQEGPQKNCHWHPFTQALWHALPQNDFSSESISSIEEKH